MASSHLLELDWDSEQNMVWSLLELPFLVLIVVAADTQQNVSMQVEVVNNSSEHTLPAQKLTFV